MFAVWLGVLAFPRQPTKRGDEIRNSSCHFQLKFLPITSSEISSHVNRVFPT